MALATRCPRCDATFRVVSDQLKLRGGLVRCGDCRHVFDAIGSLSYVEESALRITGDDPASGAALRRERTAAAAATERAAADRTIPTSDSSSPSPSPSPSPASADVGKAPGTVAAPDASADAVPRRRVVERSAARPADRWVIGVDEVAGVQRVPRSTLRPVPATVGQAAARCSAALFAWRDRDVAVLDEERLFAAFRQAVAT